MIFNSYIFLFVFLPITLLIFRLSSYHYGKRTAIAVLGIASFIYYGWWNPPYIFLLLASIIFNFYFADIISRANKKKHFLALGILLNLVLLGYFKYAGFLILNINFLFKGNYELGQILLPIGISFFTFQQIAYLSDISKGQKMKYSFVDYILFVTFFPQLIAGPIVHHKEMMPQFSKTDEDAEFNLSLGLTLFLIGLAKKVIVADNLAPHASPVFSHAANDVSFNIFEAWIGTFAYTFQLYFDFSGYSDMALGIAAMFGIFLPVNFLSPYKATNLVEFWRRWHITLSRFLRDYLYIPLGGNRKGKGRELSNLLITMVIGGLWHGANWTFVAWGFLHGLGLSVNHMVSKLTGKFKFNLKALSAVITFLFVSLTWVLFRSENFNSALSMYSTMFAFKGLVLPHEMLTAYPIFGAEYAGEFHKTPIAIIMVSGIIAFIAPNSLQLINSAKFNSPIKLPSTRLQWSPSFKWVAFMTLLFIACLLNMTNMSEFLYYQF